MVPIVGYWPQTAALGIFCCFNCSSPDIFHIFIQGQSCAIHWRVLNQQATQQEQCSANSIGAMCNSQLIIAGTAMIALLIGKAGRIHSANNKILRIFFILRAYARMIHSITSIKDYYLKKVIMHSTAIPGRYPTYGTIVYPSQFLLDTTFNTKKGFILFSNNRSGKVESYGNFQVFPLNLLLQIGDFH